MSAAFLYGTKPEKDMTDNHDGIDRRGFLECMAWAGTGVLWMMSGGVLRSYGMSQMIDHATGKLRQGLVLPQADFTFAQISDSHIGFSKPANPDVVGTLQVTIDKLNAMQERPAFVLHTGDLTHLAQADQFDVLDQSLKGVRTEKIFYVPGEHDMLDNGKLYAERFGKSTYSYDYHGVHFIGLNNVSDHVDGGLGRIGADQLQWLRNDLQGLSASTPIVLFAHIPLWAIYPDWGWGTEDSAQALALLKRFGSVSVLNGHIHQTIQKVEGNITFHTACSTAFPQPAPGSAPSAGPLKVPTEKLRSMLGMTNVQYVEHNHTLAVTDTLLS